MKQNKYLYGWNIWTNYGYGWEIESSYYKPKDSYADVKHDVKAYRFAGAQVRVTKTRVPNPKYVENFKEMPNG